MSRIALFILLFMSAGTALGQSNAGPLTGWNMVDLSHSISEKNPVYPGTEPFRSKRLATLETGIFYLNHFSMSEHSGTHIDAPSHKVKSGSHVDALEPKNLYGPLVVLDVVDEAASDADLNISLEHVRKYEDLYGEIPVGAFVVAKTGWWKKYDNAESYLNADSSGILHFPGFSAMATLFLLNERKVVGMGIDTLSTDPGSSKDFPQHKIFLAGGGVNIENLANLDKVPDAGAFLLALPIKINNGSGAPARVVAFVKDVHPDAELQSR